MKIGNVSPKNIRITPTNKKMRRASEIAKKITGGILPKELPLERKYYITSEADKFDMIKNRIQIAVEKISSIK